jgi:lipoprotein-anchoring transpeptidase ErfK/SrfK
MTSGRGGRAVALLALIAGALLTLAACTSSGQPSAGPRTVTVTRQAPSSSAPVSSPPATESTSAPATDSSTPSGPTRTVHVSSLQSDGATYGVGMPIVLFFSPPPTDSSEFTKAVKVTVDGRAADGAWFWEQPTHDEVVSNTIEAHYRMQHFWPAHSHIHVAVPIKGLSAGKGLVYSGALTSLDFSIGAKHVSTVDGHAERMRVYSDNKLVRTIRVSLGAAKTPTFTGIKVVMQKGEDAPGSDKLRPDGAVRMRGPGYDEIVDWSVRITRSGEYVHSAPWNGLIGRTSTSNGCTNLFPKTAKWFYSFAQIGDVVTYANTGGTRMPSWDGFGDWNVSWSQWQQGGLLLNH